MHEISDHRMSLSDIYTIFSEDQPIRLSEKAKERIQSCHSYLTQKIKNSNQPIYGINTGFGALCNISISAEKLEQLQYNLVVSHACGTGSEVPQKIVKLMLLLKIKSLSYGFSGVHLDTVQRLVDLYNHNILPVVYTQGSLGASGDLAPLAHLSLPLLGLGEVYYKTKKQSISKVYKEFGWKPIVLGPKEGLALLNGTQFMSAYGIYNLFEAHRLSYFSDVIASISIDAFDCNLFPFDEDIHKIRPHQGQLKTADRIRTMLEGSELAKEAKVNVQDPYSFRCVPQVHGAIKDTINFVTQTFETEINAVTDNPNIFIEADKILSGGNFHGQALAMALDYLSIAMAELANISERRCFQLVSGNRNLPAFLTYEPGLNSGFMIPQYTAASIVSQNKQLSTPASVDSIVSSNGQEDHVSMGANAATKCFQVIENVQRVLAIELMVAAQALEFRRPKQSSAFIEAFVAAYRSEVSSMQTDRVIAPDIDKTRQFLSSVLIENEELFNY